MDLKDLVRGTPGRRFSALHRVRRRRNGALKALTIVGGMLLIVLGILLVATPGPGLLAGLLGAGLIASESLFFARLLDCFELRLRALLRRKPSAPASGPASPAPANCERSARRRSP
jgi:hypothetical protein